MKLSLFFLWASITYFINLGACSGMVCAYTHTHTHKHTSVYTPSLPLILFHFIPPCTLSCFINRIKSPERMKPDQCSRCQLLSVADKRERTHKIHLGLPTSNRKKMNVSIYCNEWMEQLATRDYIWNETTFETNQSCIHWVIIKL